MPRESQVLGRLRVGGADVAWGAVVTVVESENQLVNKGDYIQ